MMRRCVAWYLVIAMFIIGIAPSVQAGFSPTETLVSGFDRTTDLETIRSALEIKQVQQRLLDLGFSTDEISARLSQLNDQQIHSFAQQLDELRVAGGFWGWILVLAIVALVVFFILPLFGVRLLG
jgi:hypothetical protein